MIKTITTVTVMVAILMCGTLWANSAPVVSNVTASQRGDDSKLVDVYYDLTDADGDLCTVWVFMSEDGGTTWGVPVFSLSGHFGQGVTPGANKHIIWDAGTDMPGKSGNYKARVYADDGKGQIPMVAVPAGAFPYQYGTWIQVDAFLIDKYEVTNLLYCQFLNDSEPDGDHWHSSQEIVRHGNPGSYTYTVQSGRENYPIRYVNLYDTQAFAAWRSSLEGVTYRLPTEQEWEKAAAWDPIEQHHYTYGFHQDSINSTWCNYNNAYGGPLPVGSFNGTGGKQDAKSYYGCYDMCGNIWEWTPSTNQGYRVFRGGAWNLNASYCRTTDRWSNYATPSERSSNLGFRLILDLD